MKDLGKFTLRLVFLFLILIIVDAVVGKAFSSFRYMAYRQNKNSDYMVPEYASRDLDAQIVIVGASDAKHSYIPSMIRDSTCLSCYNLGRDGSFTIYQLCLINLLAEHYSPKVIVWELMEDCLASDIPSDREYQSLKNLYSFYNDNVFIHNMINDMDFFQPMKMRSKLLVNNSVLMSYINSMRQTDNNLNGYYPLPNEGYIYPERISDEGYDFAAPHKEQLMKETIEKCRSKGIHIIFASAPKYTESIIKQSGCYDHLVALARDNGIPFIDSFNLKNFSDDKSLFKDVAHLNDKGAKEYMTLFIPVLRTYLEDITD